jgi:hypothetical protein
MSTRCHILIEGFKPMLYRHCDGYPGTADGSTYGVLADLIPFLMAFRKHRGFDPEYMLARMAQHLCNAFEPNAEQRAKYGPDLLSIGIGMAMHCDVAFIYRVKKNWTVEVRATTAAFWDKSTIANTTLLDTVSVKVVDVAKTGPLDQGHETPTDPILRALKAHGLPITRKGYLALADPGADPDNYPAELELELPVELRASFDPGE